jgi:hypothetical protein
VVRYPTIDDPRLSFVTPLAALFPFRGVAIGEEVRDGSRGGKEGLLSQLVLPLLRGENECGGLFEWNRKPLVWMEDFASMPIEREVFVYPPAVYIAAT